MCPLRFWDVIWRWGICKYEFVVLFLSSIFPCAAALIAACPLSPRKESQGVQNHHDGAALVQDHGQAQWNGSDQRDTQEHVYNPKGDHQILAENALTGMHIRPGSKRNWFTQRLHHRRRLSAKACCFG